MKRQKIGFIAWAMRYHNITNILVGAFVIIGIVALLKMPRNEFPQFTIRQGLVIGVYPGATSSEVEEQLTKQVENYLFGFKEVKKAKTYSESKEGLMIVYVELNDNVTNADEFWAKLKHGLNEFKPTLPAGVLSLFANSDFGDTSAMLITLSSNSRSYKDMENELKKLKSECRKIPTASKIKDYGILKEKIYVNVQPEKLNEYNIKSLSLLSSYQPNGMVSPSGVLKTDAKNLQIHFPTNFQSEKDLSNQIIFSDPRGNILKLKDIANIERSIDKDPDSYITQNGEKTILLSLEMQPGNNIVDFGKQVNKVISRFKEQCPKDIQVKIISDLPKYVDGSISDFMREFMIAIIAVVLVVMLLLPMRIASIAGFTVPISVLITLSALYFYGVELNTVSLAGLIIVLGMIVDNSIVVIDNYVEKKDHGMSSWHAAIKSARELVTPIISATLAICVVYIPLGKMLPGTAGDFVRVLPITVCVALIVSVLVALFVVPFLNFLFIKKGLKSTNNEAQKKKTFLDKMQSTFDTILEKAFKHPRATVSIGIGSIILAVILFKVIPQRLFPEVERNQFAVEVYLEQGTSLDATAKIMNSLARTLEKDKRVTTVTNFIGTSSPRFHTVYAPHMPAPNYGQLMVNTTNNETTREVCNEYEEKFKTAFPNAHVKFKILALQTTKYPIEIRISGDSIKDLKIVQEKIEPILRPIKGIAWIHSDWDEMQQNIHVELDKDKATRMGYSKGLVATSLLVGLNGIPLTTIWENDYPVSVELRQDNKKSKDVTYLGNQTITSPMSFTSIPLRSFAHFSPEWTEGTIVHRNGIRTITIQVDVDSKAMASNILTEIQPQIAKIKIPEGVNISYGGDWEGQQETFVPMGIALAISIVIIFFILLVQFKKVKLASLIMSTMLLGLPGAAIGLFVMQYPFSLTAFIGITSLCGIVVRNGIILIDYLQELRVIHGMNIKDAALGAAKRRMRPIFLTSAAASVGVIPMIISRSPLWGPLGTVICFGLLISMILTLFILPILYTMIYKEKQTKKKHIPYTNITTSAITIGLIIFINTGLPQKAISQNKVITIDSCKILALQNNKKIKDAEWEIKLASETRKSAFTNFFPKVSASGLGMRSTDYLIKGSIPSMNLPVYDGNPANLGTANQFAYVPSIPIEFMDYINVASVSVIQPVFVGGKIYNGNKLAKINYAICQQKKQLTTSDILFKTEELYWNTIALNEKLHTINSYEKLLLQLEKDVTIAVKTGLTQRSDLLKIQLKLNELKTNKLKIENGIQLSKMALCQYIGFAYDENLTLKDNDNIAELPEHFIIETRNSVKNRNEYQILENAIKAETIQKNMIIGENLPQISIGAQAMAINVMDKTNTNTLAFVNISIPISDWWSGTHKIKESQYKIEQAKNKLEETTELLSLQIEQAKNELIESYFQITTEVSSINQSKESLKEITDNYKAGISSMSDLLEAQAIYEDAQNNYTDAKCNYKIRIRNYLKAIGQ